MDFFRVSCKPFCLQSDTSTLQVLALDYIIAVYPLVLIVLVYVLVKLYYQNCTLLVLVWKPFQTCTKWFNQQWNIQTSLVDAFATFLLLSYLKFLSVSFTLLFPALALDMKGSLHTPTYLYYASTTEYLGDEHLPYVLLAIASLVMFTVLPLVLLCLYPCRSFQRLLNHYNLSFQALHIFMDTFQGSYKNGTNGTKDYRYFAAGNLVLMIAVYFSLISQMLFMKYWATFLVVAVFTGIFSICRPFKQARYNNLHITWLLLVLFFYTIPMPFLLQHNEADTFLGCIFCLVLTIPPLCIVYVIARSALLCFKGLKRCSLAIVERYRLQLLQMQEPCVDDEMGVAPLLNEERTTYSTMEIPLNA